jgi:hypothetical protein
MAKIKIESDDATAIMTLIDVLTGKRGPGCCFVDRRDCTRLTPFYGVAVSNVETALAESKRPKAAQPVRRSAP